MRSAFRQGRVLAALPNWANPLPSQGGCGLLPRVPFSIVSSATVPLERRDELLHSDIGGRSLAGGGSPHRFLGPELAPWLVQHRPESTTKRSALLPLSCALPGK